VLSDDDELAALDQVTLEATDDNELAWMDAARLEIDPASLAAAGWHISEAGESGLDDLDAQADDDAASRGAYL